MLEHLIVDSGAIIKGCGYEFHKTSKRFWTVQDVVNEIRDSKSLHLLETLPFELEIRVPSETALRAVADFARKTGDFASLSLTDMRLLALTYQMEVEENGLKYIRAEPALTLKLAKAARANSEVQAKSASKMNSEDMGVLTMVKKGEKKKESNDVEKNKGKEGVIDWNAVICEGVDGVVVEGNESDDKKEEGKKEENDDDEEEEEEEEDVNSPHFTEMVEVENVFEGVVPLQQEEDGDDDDDDDDEEGESEEEEEGEGEGNSATNATPSTSTPPTSSTPIPTASTTKATSTAINATPAQITTSRSEEKGDINFSEDFFPALSNTGPKRAKAWPLSTNENIGRLNVAAVSADGGGVFDDADEDDVDASKVNVTNDVNMNEEGEGGGDGINECGESPGSVSADVGAPPPAVVVKNWSQVAALSVKAAVITASENKHTVENSSFNSTRDWSRKPKNYKKNNASMPAKTEKTEENTSATDVTSDGISVLPSKPTVPFFSNLKTQPMSMPSRIMGGSGGSGPLSELAAKKAQMEDDGAGWINPQNILKYRAGAHISMVQFDKPTGRGNSGVHTDFKEATSGLVTHSNMNSGTGGNGEGRDKGGKERSEVNQSDTKSMTSRQSNYKTNPTDPMRSMSSMMMMGKNTITTSIPIESWKDLKYSKTNSHAFFSTPGQTVNSENIRKNRFENTDLRQNDVESMINSTQHLTISNNQNMSSSVEGSDISNENKENANNDNVNTTKRTKNNTRNESESYSMKSACVTTDFSMQNVLMQMGLNVISVDGMLIRAAKQWVLRCMACFKVHYDMDRLFCSKCGANHLSRVGASVNAKTGELKLHLKANYVVNKLGTKYSIAKPGSRGRYEGELLLREDQLLSGIWRQKNVKIKKNVISFFGADVTSDVGIHVNKGQAIVVGMGKKNPNSQKGRERRGKCKK